VTANLPSLQDVLSRRQHANFVGRQAQIAQFRSNAVTPLDSPDRKFIFNVHGDAGIGKTFLARQLAHAAMEAGWSTAYTDEAIYDLPGVMAAIASELTSSGPAFEPFHKLHTTYLRRRSELENDPQAPEGTPSFLTTTAVRMGLAAVRGVPVVGGALSAVDDAAVAEQADRLRKYISTKLRSTEIRLLLSPAEALTPVFVEGILASSARHSMALFFDTYEHTAPLLDDWLLDLLKGRYGVLPANIVVTVSGQKPLDPNKWAPFLDVISDVPLTPFSDMEIRQLLSNKGVTNLDVVEVIQALSGGLPLLVAMLAEGRPEDPTYIGDPTGNAVERFLRWEGDPRKRAIALAAALPRWLDKDVLSVIINSAGEEDSTFAWLRKLAFVADHAGRCTYHGIVRESMIRVLRNESPQHWRELHRRLAGQHHAWRDALELRDDTGWNDQAWVSHTLEETYHLLCLDAPAALPKALSDAVHACQAGVIVSRRWAEMIRQAGDDTDNASARRWGELLRGAAEDEHAYVSGYLSGVLASGLLDDATQAIALAERGEAQRLMRHYDEALADFNQAIDINPKLTWAIAGRGETYRALNRYPDALADFDRAISQSPGLAWAIVDRGIARRQMRRYNDALRDFDTAIELDNSYSWAIANRGETYRRLGRYNAAVSDFDRAITIDQDYAWALASRGRAFLRMKRYEDALRDFNQAVALDRDLTWVYSFRARAFRSMGRLDEAIGDFDRVIHSAPEDAWAIASRGRAYLSKKWYDEAIADFDRAIELRPDLDWAVASRGETYRQMKRYTEALADFDRALEIDPSFDYAKSQRELTLASMPSTP
jgi:tetratricopeptide (TPR) repeat protein